MKMWILALMFASTCALAQDQAAVKVTAYCYSVKAKDALAFLIDEKPVGMPADALSGIREMVAKGKATDLGTLVVPAEQAKYATGTAKDIQMDLECVIGPQNFVSLNAAVNAKGGKVVGSVIVDQGRGGGKPGSPIVKGLAFLGCAYRDVGKTEVAFVFVTVGK